MTESSASVREGVAAPRLKRVLTLWDLIFYGIVLVQPIAPVPLSRIRAALPLLRNVEPNSSRKRCTQTARPFRAYVRETVCPKGWEGVVIPENRRSVRERRSIDGAAAWIISGWSSATRN